MTASFEEPVVRLGDPGITDRHTAYALLRDRGPVHPARTPDGARAWLVTRYEEAREALAHPALSMRPPDTAAPPGEGRDKDAARTSLGAVLDRNMLLSDPPDHTRMRRTVNRVFTPRRTAVLRPRIAALTDELLERMAERPGVDLLEEFAFPLPLAVIGELLGVPEADRARLKAFTDTLVRGAERADDPAGVAAASEGAVALLTDVCAAKHEEPGDDLLSALVRGEPDGGGGSGAGAVEGERLERTEAVAMAFLLLFGGYETVAHFLCNSVITLLAHPGHLDALRAEPSLMPGVVDELLRYEGPVDATTLRYSTEPLRLGETEIPVGERVVISLQSVNRDGRRFAHPDRFGPPGQEGPEREAGGHLAFGHGIHYCVGAPLARLESEIALSRLFARFPELRLDVPPDQLDWHHVMGLRGIRSLPVVL